MSTSAEQPKGYSGPAILSQGFRPLFLSGAVWAAVAMALWLLMYRGAVVLPTGFSPLDWHVHELLYGYLPAIVAGFLLTAIPNWTGRLPVAGGPLLFLVLCWWAGRVAVLVSDRLGPGVTAVIDIAFLAALGAIITREIVAGRNWRNAKMLVLVGLLLLGNVAFHVEASGGAASGGYGARLGIAAAVLLISVIGGRIVPSFTRNWLARRPEGRLPTPFTRFDLAAIGAGGIALGAWVLLPGGIATALLCILAGLAHAARLARWSPDRTAAEPLVWILHAGYAMVPAGFFLVGAATLFPQAIMPAASVHAWTTGAIGAMTLAVMTRASLGHTGRPLHATPAITAIYVAVLAAAILRVLAGVGVPSVAILHLGAGLWIVAFAGFATTFAPFLLRRRA